MPRPADPLLRFDAVHKTYSNITAVDGVSLDIAAGSFTALVGASGSGKSTLLKTVNRLVEPTSGRVLLGMADVAAASPAQLRRSIGYVFQGVGLFPHMTIGENLSITRRIAGERDNTGRLSALLDLVELDQGYEPRYPHELSGGERQRIGVARALAAQPELMLMDEPFGALDPVTRDALGTSVRRLHARLGLTTIMVTHDMAEALLLADRVLVMDQGSLIADETPQALLSGAGGEIAQGMVAVPRNQAAQLAGLTR
ncbi:ATP-binding cassette domain-containing protein [Altererythrobacter aquiaggeris]|uniref:ATP-binding cassette domain-containing protein n=1 Tax=Aestuarierythrobacter aquiaggeris TaxID=1898396 RepID=UPI003017DCF0